MCVVGSPPMTKTIIARENTIVKSGVRGNLRKSLPKLKGYQDDGAFSLGGVREAFSGDVGERARAYGQELMYRKMRGLYGEPQNRGNRVKPVGLAVVIHMKSGRPPPTLDC